MPETLLSRVVQGTPIQWRIATLFSLGAALMLAPAAAHAAAVSDRDRSLPASGNAVIAGVVRDVQGVAQMGALVQVLAANSMTVATAYTDQHGRYVVPNLNPGKYLVRASATLFVPATRANLQLRTGATAVVNLTLAALFDTTAWLPAQRRRADETEDDWKWTLRSTANRPILRLVEDGSAIEISSSAEQGSATIRAKALGAVESGDGGFGRSGVHTVTTVHRGLDDGSDLMFRADLGTSTRPVGDQVASRYAASEFDLGYEARTGFGGGASRTVVRYMAHPELTGPGIAPGSGGLEVFEMTSAQRMSLGERVEVEAGGRIQAVQAGASAVATHPFLRVSAHPAGSWTLEYRLSSDRELQQFGDVSSSEGDVPVALVREGKLALESGHHQQLSVGHGDARAGIQVAFYHDSLANVAVAGGEAAAGPAVVNPQQEALAPPVMSVAEGMLLDSATGSFRGLASGYTTSGLRLTASSALTPSLWIAAEYSSGEALASEAGDLSGRPLQFNEALARLKTQRSQTATIALKGKIVGTGTRVRASYRWQPVSGVSAVDPYSAFGDQAYLSCLLRQSIRVGHLLPQGMQATIDVTNLLAQGYRPFLSADGQTLYFAQAPRVIQAGLSFSF